MITEKQEKINRIEVEEYDKALEEQKAKFEEFLRFTVTSATSYQCTEPVIDDWMETPEQTAKLIIELQKHT